MDFLSFHWAVKWPIPVKGLIIAYTLTEELLLLNQHKLDWSKHIATCNMWCITLCNIMLQGYMTICLGYTTPKSGLCLSRGKAEVLNKCKQAGYST